MRTILVTSAILLSLLTLACDQDVEVTPAGTTPSAPGGSSVATVQPTLPPGPRIASSIPLKIGTPNGVAVNPSTNRVYVAYIDTDALSIFDTQTRQEVGRLDLPAGGGHQVAVNPVTNRLYVANPGNGTVSIIDGSTLETLATLDLHTRLVNTNSATLAVDSVNNRVYTSRRDGATAQLGPIDSVGLGVIDGESNDISATIDLDGPAQVITLDPTTNRVFVVIESWAQLYRVCPSDQNVVLIDGATDSVTGCLNYLNALTVAPEPSGDLMYVMSNVYGNEKFVATLHQIERDTLRVVSTISLPGLDVRQTQLDPVTGRVYMTAVDAPRGPAFGTPDPEGGLLLMMDAQADQISDRLSLPALPLALTVDPGSHVAYVATSDRMLQVIEDR